MRLKQEQEQELSLPFGERVTFLCLCKEKITKRKHTLPTRPRRCATRVHSASGIFRHDIPVVAKNDVHPCTSPFGFFPLAPSLRKGPGESKSKATATATATAKARATAKATPPQPSPCLRQREGAELHLAKGGSRAALGKGREQSCTWQRKGAQPSLAKKRG